jgi:hypothetical protein
MKTNTLSNLISKREIVGMKYMETYKRQSAFGFYDEEADTNDKSFIDTCINQNRENRYFDKYGNEFTIDEISK